MIAGTLEIQLLANVARLADDMSKAKSAVKDGVDQINRLLGTIGIGLSLKGMTDIIAGANEATASFVRLGDVAGSTAAQISAFELPARLAGTSLDAVASSVAKLSRSIGEARLGDQNKKSLLEALGIDPDDGRDAAEIFIDVAKAVAQMGDQNVAAKVTADLLGKSFSEMRPLLKEISESGHLVATTTDEQSKQAKELEDNWQKLVQIEKQAARDLVAEVVPSLNKAAEAMQRVNQSHGWIDGIKAGLQTIVFGSNTKEMNQQIENMLKGADPKKVADATSAAAAQAKKDQASKAQEAIQELMAFNRDYDALVAQAKNSAALYADMVKSENAELAELYKQGLVDDAVLIQRTSENENARLQVLISALNEEEALAKRKGDLKRQQMAADAIVLAQQQQQANQRLTKSRLETLDIVNDQQFNASLANQLSAVIEHNKTEIQLAEEKYAREQDLLDTAGQRGLITDDYWQGQSMLLYAAYEANLTALHDAELMKRYGISQVYHQLDLKAASSFFGALGAMMASHSRVAFEIGKAAAISQTVIDTYRAAQGAYAALAGIPIIGPSLGIAAAAAAIVAGLARVQQIKATSFGTGGVSGGATGTFDANPNTGLPTAPVSPLAQPPAQAPSQTVINVSVTGVVTQDVVDQLIGQLKDSIGNRDAIIIGPNSRQAMELA